jgi:hypothetical protein
MASSTVFEVKQSDPDRPEEDIGPKLKSGHLRIEN